MDSATWTNAAFEELLGSLAEDGGLPYEHGWAPASEPTALLAMALLAHRAADPAVRRACAWLMARQRADGFFAASAAHGDRSWTTPLAALALHRAGSADPAVQAAATALLAAPVHTFLNTTPWLYATDTSIPGWPWTMADVGFVEPTAMAMIFLKALGRGSETRVRQGAALLRDRALPGGGWNYGEAVVLGEPMYPAIVPTALALLALADEADGTTQAALNWLRGQRGRIRSLVSLGWAATAVAVCGPDGEDWTADVQSAWAAVPDHRRSVLGKALCLLGIAGHAAHPLAITG